MEELKLLIEAVAGLPTITLWVLVGYLVYKLAVIGSIYGLIRFAIAKFVEWRTLPKAYTIAGKPISEDVAKELDLQINRFAGSYSYIHSSDIDKLKKAIDIVIKGNQ